MLIGGHADFVIDHLVRVPSTRFRVNESGWCHNGPAIKGINRSKIINISSERHWKWPEVQDWGQIGGQVEIWGKIRAKGSEWDQVPAEDQVQRGKVNLHITATVTPAEGEGLQARARQQDHQRRHPEGRQRDRRRREIKPKDPARGRQR